MENLTTNGSGLRKWSKLIQKFIVEILGMLFSY